MGVLSRTGDNPVTDTGRTRSFGQSVTLGPLERFGVWLSGRSLRRSTGDPTGLAMGDFGCGFEAATARHLLPAASRVVLIDVALAPDLQEDPKVEAVEGLLPAAMAGIETGSLDLVLCLSVLEHLTDPEGMLAELRRVTAPGGVCVINVPNWLGKRFLEFVAFRLNMSRDEMDDHKTYYDPKDLWPLLIRAGFQPHAIRCRRHKFGLNTLAVCRVDLPVSS